MQPYRIGSCYVIAGMVSDSKNCCSKNWVVNTELFFKIGIIKALSGSLLMITEEYAQ